MAWLPTSPVARVLLAEGAIELSFGLALAAFPVEILSTIFDLPAMGVSAKARGSLGESLIVTLAHTYAILGASLAAVALSSDAGPTATSRLAAVALVGHAARCAKCVLEARRPWITGNPWHDVVVHSSFVLAYGYVLKQ